ncbi:MAG: DUF4293 domain-containing protein [Chitinophagaceae bacterium]|jgi:hypothetical protein|nr:DUF4293 domain-containing protein [Chitinophagaceae bacterium]OQY92842.1 MAG: hypothetical protein B6D37_13155 [Sphingobacteriales bacterium UTBCD1]
MIQRKQSLWLLLSTVCAFLSYILPFFSGTKQGANGIEKALVDATSTIPVMILTGLSLLLSLVTIFLFKDRKLQFRLCIGGVLLSILIIALYFLEIRKLSGSISLSAIFVFAVLIGYIMAAAGVHKDEKLVKTLDRLR